MVVYSMLGMAEVATQSG